MELSWKEVEDRLGIAIPARLKAAYDASPREAEYFSLYSKDDVMSLRFLSPSAPLRFLPLADSAGGDSLGIYFPNVGECFVGLWIVETGVFQPVATRPEIIVESPDQFDHYAHLPRTELPPDLLGDPDWRSLKMQLNTADPFSELLKPMALNELFMDALGTPDFDHLMQEVLGGESIARQAFESVVDGHMVANWREFAKFLEESGQRGSALAALDNARYVLWWYPYNGFPERCGDSWGELGMILESMSGVASDQFDKAIIEYWRSNLDQWLADADAGKGAEAEFEG